MNHINQIRGKYTSFGFGTFKCIHLKTKIKHNTPFWSLDVREEIMGHLHFHLL